MYPSQGRCRVTVKVSSRPALGPIWAQRLFSSGPPVLVFSVWFTECCHFSALYFHNHTFKPDKVQDPECLQLPRIDRQSSCPPPQPASQPRLIESSWTEASRDQKRQLVQEGQGMPVYPCLLCYSSKPQSLLTPRPVGKKWRTWACHVQNWLRWKGDSES